MSQDRRIVLQLLALGRINPAQAERLIAACDSQRESAWVLAGCAAMAIATQMQSIAPAVVHGMRDFLSGGMPAAQHVLMQVMRAL